MSRLFTYLLLFIACLSAQAQETIADFTLPDVKSGSDLSLSQLNGSGIVLIFTSNRCPFDGYYRDRLRGLIQSYQGKVQFVLINAYPEQDEPVDQMKSAYSGWGLSVPYLADKNQVALQSLGAKKSPEAILLKPAGSGFQVMYHGGIDDNPQSPASVSRSWLKEAVDNFLAGRPVEAGQTRTAGCTIRRK